jgi:predicted RNA-binding Zn ribbon-like protein
MTSQRQPGDRPAAPGDLALVQSFVNSRWDLDQDHREQLRSPSELARWLAGHGLLESGAKLTRADLNRALDAREGLRALLFINNGAAPKPHAIERLNSALGRSAVTVEFAASGAPAFTPRGRGLDAALASMASIVAVARADGSWSRLKACPGVHCGWAFYDHSRNHAGSWCSMSLCGSRTKAREYRRRKKDRAQA